MKTITLETPYRRGCPSLSGMLMNHARYMELLHEAADKMASTAGDPKPFTLPVHLDSKDSSNAIWIDKQGGIEAVRDRPDFYDLPEPTPIGHVVGVFFHKDRDGRYSLDVEYEEDQPNAIFSNHQNVEQFFNSQPMAYYSTIGIMERRGELTTMEPEKLVGFHLSPESDAIYETGVIPK